MLAALRGPGEPGPDIESAPSFINRNLVAARQTEAEAGMARRVPTFEDARSAPRDAEGGQPRQRDRDPPEGDEGLGDELKARSTNFVAF
jgi:hypothetical protein